MGKLESNVRKVKLRTKFAVLMVTLFAVALAVNVVWTIEASVNKPRMNCRKRVWCSRSK